MKTEAIRLCIQAQYGKLDYRPAREELEAMTARIAKLEAALSEILYYKGGADSALEDEYVMARARKALEE